MYSRKMCKFDLKPYPRIVSQNNTAINNILCKILEKRIRKIGSLNECCRSLKVDRLAYLYSHKGMTSLIRFTALVSLSRTLI